MKLGEALGVDASGDDSGEVAEAIAEALGDASDAEIVDTLRQLLQDEVRHRARVKG